MSSITTNSVTAPTKRNKYLRFVDNLDDYKVHHDHTDIRNFSVKTISGESIGEVEGLLADTEALRVRYVEVELDEAVINRHTRGLYTDEDRHVLVPIGLIRINESDRLVNIVGVRIEHMNDYPRYKRANGYTTSYELDTNNYLAGFHEYGNAYDRDVYDTDHYRTSDSLGDSFYNNRFYTHA